VEILDFMEMAPFGVALFLTAAAMTPAASADDAATAGPVKDG